MNWPTADQLRNAYRPADPDKPIYTQAHIDQARLEAYERGERDTWSTAFCVGVIAAVVLYTFAWAGINLLTR